uniref:Uncharacterized protein n=1 Tax=Anguilla anguilla TaxID=7936 RepID=A0A0E9RSZ8_ANGAN
MQTVSASMKTVC